MKAVLDGINRIVWGAPALVLIIGVGLYLSLRTNFLQFTALPGALKAFVRQLKKKDTHSGVSSYQALCTALAATVGIGNIAGVAGAIAIGGPGAVFWMWICGFLGMITKFAEVTLALRYRIKSSDGKYIGGPMYMVEKGMGARWRWLASIYCFFGVIACFGVGNATQINAFVSGINGIAATFGFRENFLGNLIIGIIAGVFIFILLSGGAKRIGVAAERIVPFAAVGYLLLCLIVLAFKSKNLPYVFHTIFEGAFQPQAVTGGVIGSAFTALRVGASRGVFTNEAGMGTASIAHASADVKHPVEQGLMGLVEVFIDTIVICTLTALVILCSGVRIPYGLDTGGFLTTQAFCAVLGDWVSVLIAMFLCLFAIATVLGWGLYGIRCAQYLFGEKGSKGFIYLQAFMVAFGAVMGTGTVWTISEIVNGLMAIPNLIALAYLSPELIRQLKDYKHVLNGSLT